MMMLRRETNNHIDHLIEKEQDGQFRRLRNMSIIESTTTPTSMAISITYSTDDMEK